MLESWWIVGAVVGGLTVLLVGYALTRSGRTERSLQDARDKFHRQREWLEARFLTLASQSGRPRGLRWADCDFEDDVSFARDRQTGGLRALVGVTIRFEAIEGGGMEEVEAVDNDKAATVVFRLDGPEWESDGRAVFNLNPHETIDHFGRELERLESAAGDQNLS